MFLNKYKNNYKQMKEKATAFDLIEPKWRKSDSKIKELRKLVWDREQLIFSLGKDKWQNEQVNINRDVAINLVVEAMSIGNSNNMPVTQIVDRVLEKFGKSLAKHSDSDSDSDSVSEEHKLAVLDVTSQMLEVSKDLDDDTTNKVLEFAQNTIENTFYEEIEPIDASAILEFENCFERDKFVSDNKIEIGKKCFVKTNKKMYEFSEGGAWIKI